MQKGIVINLLDKEIRDVGAWDEPASQVEWIDQRAIGVWTSGPAETPSDWMTTPTPLSARFTVAVSSASPAIFSNLGWSTGILRADRASARTECPASRAAFTVSRPIPLLAPMIRTFPTPSCSRSALPGSTSCAIQAPAPPDGRAD